MRRAAVCRWLLATQSRPSVLADVVVALLSLSLFSPCRDLDTNSISGTVPTTIGMLTQLTQLYAARTHTHAHLRSTRTRPSL